MTKKETKIIQTEPRDTVEIHLSDDRVFSGPRGTSIGQFLKALPEWDNPPIMGAIVNNELRELTYPIEIDSKVKPITMADGDGARIYRRSITFLLEAAFEDLYPESSLVVDHSVSSGGFYCRVTNRDPLSNEELWKLESRMKELVNANLPFERKQVPIKEAIDLFSQKKQDDKVQLLKYRQKEFLILYSLEGHKDYHHGYMVPSTGYLRWFALIPLGDGFVIQYPRRNSPTQLLPMPDYPKLLITFRQYGDWLVKLGIDSVGALNSSIDSGKTKEIILVSEALHEQKIADTARAIVDHAKKARIILISGPSSSGKTTFSKRLAIQLLALGLSPFALEMDNYFVDREKTPKDENGEYDYEALGTLNTELLSEHLVQLIAGEEVQLPYYNFRAGKSEPGRIVQLRKDQLIIIEGIHGLNPKLLPDIPTEQTFKIYVSCLTQLNLDRHNRISTTDTRMIRRIVRDSATRGYTAQQTIQRWESVRRGEKNYIFPYQENADDLFNSALVYELSALKPFAEPLLRQVPYGTAEYIESKRLLALLDWFLEIPDDLIPDNSILREFLGGSILADFLVWQNSNGS
jgi:uridine kinase